MKFLHTFDVKFSKFKLACSVFKPRKLGFLDLKILNEADSSLSASLTKITFPFLTNCTEYQHYLSILNTFKLLY